MIVTAYDNATLPTADRLEDWRDQMKRSLVPSDVTVPSADGFRASLKSLDMGVAQMNCLSLTPMRFYRGPKQIRDSDAEQLCAGLVVSGGQAVSQYGRDAVPGLFDLVLYDSSHPHHGWVSDSGGVARNLVAQVPRSLLTLPMNQVRDISAVSLTTRSGVAALLAQFMLRLSQDAELYRPSDGPRLGTALLDLLSATLAHELDAERALLPESHRRVLLLRVQAFIQQHLGDPELSPGVIAAAHQISLRHLHRLFDQQDTTVAASIRRLRLERCCRDLADPSLGSRTIHSIAARWGFCRPADFTRSFRAAYGMPPSDYRALSLRPAVRARSAKHWAPTANDPRSSGAQDDRGPGRSAPRDSQEDA
ncbi:helix-turn-helix domain-containing protein [Streptomyces sp. NPDC127072]|uniref:helix-turn-helix domain-containing protein n=1 Tax=Streptomyces sp. NPDC127072 TaxID=3347129 RepID=UPI0036600D42